MSEDTTANDTNNVEVEDVESAPIDNLRNAYKQEKAERKALQQELMDVALSSMGLDPSKGIGKAVLKTYEGKPNVEETKNDVSDNVIQAQSRVEQLNKIGVSSEPVDVMDAFKEVVSSGDVKQSIAAKLAMIEKTK